MSRVKSKEALDLQFKPIHKMKGISLDAEANVDPTRRGLGTHLVAGKQQQKTKKNIIFLYRY
jgi:hypothetical protein